jgi:hypothetical protein
MVPPILQLPLGDTISVIADTDFYEQWLNLVPVLLFWTTIDFFRILSLDLILQIWSLRMQCYKLLILCLKDGVQNFAPMNCFPK